MKCVITGNPKKGLGKAFADHFKSKGYEIVFIRSKDTDEIFLKKIKDCTLFINNAYGKHNVQASILVSLKQKFPKMITIGSMTSIFPDKRNFEYSNNKRALQNTHYNHCTLINKSHCHLLLSLSTSAYEDLNLIMNSVDFWLQNPSITEMKFGQDQNE